MKSLEDLEEKYDRLAGLVNATKILETKLESVERKTAEIAKAVGSIESGLKQISFSLMAQPTTALGKIIGHLKGR